jgi:hypothetical protein
LADHQKHAKNSLCHFILFTTPIIHCSIKGTAALGCLSKPIDIYFGTHFHPPPELWDSIHLNVNHTTLDYKSKLNPTDMLDICNSHSHSFPFAFVPPFLCYDLWLPH